MNTYTGWDEYGWRHQAEHLFAAELYTELYDLTLDREWLVAQRAFDPSHQAYAESLDWALQAAETDKDGLPVLLALTLLRATLASLANRMSSAILEIMARLGLTGQAEATLALQTDPLSKCEALCRLVRLAGPGANGTRAAEMLLEAEALTTTVTNRRTQTHMLALIAVAAQEVDAPDIFSRAIAGVRAAYTNHDWTATHVAREFDLLEQPDYLLALAAWDRQEGEPKQTGVSPSDRYAALARLVPVAVARRDQAVLKAIVATADPLQATNRGLSAYHVTGIVAALAANGADDKAMALIAAWHGANQRYRMYDPQPLLEALARGAGERGDVKTIEKAANLAQTYLRTQTASAPAWEKWLSRLREAGQRALGMSQVTHTKIQLAGLEGLATNYPQQAQEFWERIRGEAGWLWRLFAPDQALMQPVLAIDPSPQPIGSKKPAPVAVPRSVAAGLALARWDPDVDDRDLNLADYAEILAWLGELDRALAATDEISDADKRAWAQAEIVTAALARNEFEVALGVAAKITRPGARHRALNAIAEALAETPRERARGLLQQLTGETGVLAEEEVLAQTVLFPVLMGELARATSVSHVLAVVRDTFGPTAIPAALPALSEAAVVRKDVAGARQLLAQIEVVGVKRTRREILAEKLPAPPGWTQEKERKRVRQIEVIAALAEQWGMAAARQADPALARQWAALAAAAFDLARQQARQLLPLAARGWPVAALARVARRLRDSKTLKDLHKQAAGLGGAYDAQGVRDEALVQVAVGLTKTGDYLQRETLFQPPAIADIRHKHYRAQALAEMSEVVRTAPPQKRVFQAGLNRDDLQYFADRLLDQAREALGLSRSRFLTGLTGFKQRSSLAIGGREDGPATTQAMETSPLDTSNRSPVTYQSARPALVAIVGVFARTGRSDDVVQIAEEAPAPGHKPAVVAAAVKALAQAGEVDRAQRLWQRLSSGQERALAAAGLASVLANEDPVQAEQLTQAEVLPRLWDGTHMKIALTAVGETAVHLPPPARLRLIHAVLRASRLRNRRDTLTAMATLIPAAVTLMAGAQRRNVVEKIVEMETWWGATAPPV